MAEEKKKKWVPKNKKESTETEKKDEGKKPGRSAKDVRGKLYGSKD